MKNNDRQTVFITGGTGYIGIRLINILLKQGHTCIVLVRKGSEHKVPTGCKTVTGNPFDASTFQQHIPNGSTFIQLLGIPHPSPKKKNEFYRIDLPSVQASVEAATAAEAGHFIYVSVSKTPTKIMADYQAVRKQGEQLLEDSGLKYTVLRPWYVLGPGHRWPVLLIPFYKILEKIPATRAKALDLGLVTLSQMLQALVYAVENPPMQNRELNVPDIRRFQKLSGI